MASAQDTNERLTLLREVVALGKEIETAFESKIQRDFKGRVPYDIPDEDLDSYFVYQFVNNALEHAASLLQTTTFLQVKSWLTLIHSLRSEQLLFLLSEFFIRQDAFALQFC
jgi:hypothetical protein